jgi:RNA polymerase sigma-70 factor, ECF subfamily
MPTGAVSDLDYVSELYASLSTRLERIVGTDVRAPRPLIEDACQSAWWSLWRERDQVCRDCALPWLVTTAVREALRLVRGQAGLVSLEEALDESGDRALPAHAPPAADVCELRARLDDCMRLLPQRQQRLLWLHGFGFSYAEIADRTGSSMRTVERQLLRGKRKLRSVAAD